MPIIPVQNVAQYDSVTIALNSAKSRLNDRLNTLLPVSGSILGNTSDSTLQSLNNAWRRQQDYLADRGYARLINEQVIFGLPPVASLDPSTQTWLSWEGYFDGANLWQTPQLPSDFTHPLKVWERWSGQNAQFVDPPMEKILDGIPAVAKGPGIQFWEWRGDAIYMPGSQMLEDLRVRYVKYLADFSDIGQVRWFQQPIPIMRAADSLSWFLCAEVVGARGEEALSESFMEKGKTALAHLFNLDVRADQRVNIQRQPRGRNFRGVW